MIRRQGYNFTRYANCRLFMSANQTSYSVLAAVGRSAAACSLPEVRTVPYRSWGALSRKHVRVMLWGVCAHVHETPYHSQLWCWPCLPCSSRTDFDEGCRNELNHAGGFKVRTWLCHMKIRGSEISSQLPTGLFLTPSRHCRLLYIGHFSLPFPVLVCLLEVGEHP